MNELIQDRAGNGGDADGGAGHGGAGETAVLVSAECLRLTPAAPIVGWWPARHAGLLDQYSVAMAMHMPTAANDGNALKAGHVER
jgi:hypothetical protein